MRKWRDLSTTEKSLAVVAGVSATIAVSLLVREAIKIDMRKVVSSAPKDLYNGKLRYVMRFGQKSSDYWNKRIYGDDIL